MPDRVSYAFSRLPIRTDGLEAFHNYLSFLGNWSAINDNGWGNGTSTDLSKRPPVFGLLNDNTTVTGQWVQTSHSDMTANFEKFRRVINNVTMSFPHANVLPAARNRINNILQPEDLNGVGQYMVRASVVSPTINVLCVNAMSSEIDPLIYTNWPNSTTENTTGIPGQVHAANPQYIGEMNSTRWDQRFLNSTPVDDIFEWGPKYNRSPAAFPQVRISL